MAVTKDDTTQGAVAPRPISPGGSPPPSQGGGGGPNVSFEEAFPDARVISYIGQVVKDQPQISQYALRAAVMTATARMLNGDNDPLSYPYADYLRDLTGYLQAPSTVMDAIEARIALKLGAGSNWVRNPQPVYEDWSPEGLLNEWLMGPSAANAAGVVGTLRAEAQGQGVPGAPLGTAASQQDFIQRSAGLMTEQEQGPALPVGTGRAEVMPGP